jgi:flagellar biosynthesis/type III secretory pathway chaperone
MPATQIIADAIGVVGQTLATHIATLHAEREAVAQGDLEGVASCAARKRHEVIAVQSARNQLGRSLDTVSYAASPADWVAKQDQHLQAAYADMLGKTRLAQELTQANGRLIAVLINATQARLAVLQGAVPHSATYGRAGYSGAGGGIASYGVVSAA